MGSGRGTIDGLAKARAETSMKAVDLDAERQRTGAGQQGGARPSWGCVGLRSGEQRDIFKKRFALLVALGVLFEVVLALALAMQSGLLASKMQPRKVRAAHEPTVSVMTMPNLPHFGRTRSNVKSSAFTCLRVHRHEEAPLIYEAKVDTPSRTTL